jgi:hypothetical protein
MRGATRPIVMDVSALSAYISRVLRSLSLPQSSLPNQPLRGPSPGTAPWRFISAGAENEMHKMISPVNADTRWSQVVSERVRAIHKQSQDATARASTNRNPEDLAKLARVELSDEEVAEDHP